MQVSLVIPCFNSLDTIERCIHSVRNIAFDSRSFEVIFVDDASSDGTDSYLRKACEQRNNWRFYQLEANSGSPSGPRNLGMENARGKYIYFLDCDDEILPDALSELYRLAEKSSACLVRSELITDDGVKRRRINQIPEWHAGLDLKNRIELIVARQSFVVTSLVKRSRLMESEIRFREHLRRGEDTVFLAEVMTAADVIEYLDKPTFVYHIRKVSAPGNRLRYGDKEIQDHLYVWREVQSILRKNNIDYIENKAMGIKGVLDALTRNTHGAVSEKTFDALHEFFCIHASTLRKVSLPDRLEDLRRAILCGDFSAFDHAVKASEGQMARRDGGG